MKSARQSRLLSIFSCLTLACGANTFAQTKQTPAGDAVQKTGTFSFQIWSSVSATSEGGIKGLTTVKIGNGSVDYDITVDIRDGKMIETGFSNMQATAAAEHFDIVIDVGLQVGPIKFSADATIGTEVEIAEIKAKAIGNNKVRLTVKSVKNVTVTPGVSLPLTHGGYQFDIKSRK